LSRTISPLKGFIAINILYLAKGCEIHQGCVFWGFQEKIFTSTATNPQIPKIVHYNSRFLLLAL